MAGDGREIFRGLVHLGGDRYRVPRDRASGWLSGWAKAGDVVEVRPSGPGCWRLIRVGNNERDRFYTHVGDTAAVSPLPVLADVTPWQLGSVPGAEELARIFELAAEGVPGREVWSFRYDQQVPDAPGTWVQIEVGGETSRLAGMFELGQERPADPPSPEQIDWSTFEPSGLDDSGSGSLCEEFATYRKCLTDLLRKAGQYVLIKGREVVGFYPDQDAALDAAAEKFGEDPALVKKIAASDSLKYLGTAGA